MKFKKEFSLLLSAILFFSFVYYYDLLINVKIPLYKTVLKFKLLNLKQEQKFKFDFVLNI